MDSEHKNDLVKFTRRYCPGLHESLGKETPSSTVTVLGYGTVPGVVRLLSRKMSGTMVAMHNIAPSHREKWCN